ncbi:MAG: hypothetical protein JJT76_18725 [Clostridiaceae bacterium]|nr:hypothetical protein [Clostridiaceae bacterium]
MNEKTIKSISSKLHDGFESKLFETSLKELEDINSPIRINTFSLSLRELIRHILARLAPDEKVLRSKWYENLTDKEHGVTRQQRMLYAIKGGLLDEFIINELNLDLNKVTKKLKKVIDNLST